MHHRGRTGIGVAVVAALVVLAAPVEAQTVGRAGRGPITLEEAIELALARNLEIEDSRFALEEADLQVREAWGNVFPSMDLSTTYTRNLSVPTMFMPGAFLDPTADPDEMVALQVGADNTWGLQLQGEQPLFNAAAFLGVGAAGRYRSLREEMHRGTAQQVVTRVRLAYYDVLLAQEALRLNENSVRRVRQVLEETEALHRSGLASEYDVLRLRVELTNLEPGLRRSHNAVAATRRALGVELGLDIAETLEVAGSLVGIDVADSDGGIGEAYAPRQVGARPVDAAAAGLDPLGAGLASMTVDEVVDLAMRNRSELRQLELTEELRRTELRLERTEYLPKVFLFGTYSINAQQSGSPRFFGETSMQRAYGRQLGIRVSVPVFSGFQRPARIGQRRAAVDQVRTQREQLAAYTEHQVRTLHAQVQEAAERAAAQRIAVEQAQRGYAIATAEHRAGTASRLAVTDAEIALRQSEFNYAEAMYEYLAARARLDEIVGTVPGVDSGLSIAIERQ